MAPGTIADDAGCDGDRFGILGQLPATPDGTIAWTVVGGDDSMNAALEQVAAIEALGTRVFRSSNPNGSPSIDGDPPAACTIVAAPEQLGS